MLSIRRTVVVLLAMVGVASCSDATLIPPPSGVSNVQRDSSAAVQTDSMLIHLTFKSPSYYASAPIHLTISNPRPDTSFIINCGGSFPMQLEKLVGSTWVPALGSVVPACFSAAIVIPPGGRYETSSYIDGAMAGSNSEPKFAMDDVPGVYRFVLEGIVDSYTSTPPHWGNDIPVEYRRSNPFVIAVLP